MTKIKLFGSNPLNQILAINIIVYIIGVIMYLISEETYKIFQIIFSLKSNLKIDFYTPFSFITHGFIHINYLHLIGNIIIFGLYYPIFLKIEKQYVWKIYLTSVFVTGIFFIMYINWYVLEPSILLGMSGGLFALISYCSNRWGDMQIVKWNFLNVKLRHLFYLHLIISIMKFLNNDNSGGEVCHLVGALVGWYLYKSIQEKTYVINEEENKKSEE